MVPLSMTLSDLCPGIQGHDIFLKSNIRKTARLKDKATVAQEESNLQMQDRKLRHRSKDSAM